MDIVEKKSDARSEMMERKAEAEAKLALTKAEAEAKLAEEKEKSACLARIKAILAAHGGEANIGQTNEYWSLLNQFRSYP